MVLGHKENPLVPHVTLVFSFQPVDYTSELFAFVPI